MALAQRQPFIASGEFVARKKFTFDAVDYLPGDDFPYDELGCEARKLRNLYDAGYIMHKVTEEAKTEKKLKIVKKNQKLDPEEENEESEEDDNKDPEDEDSEPEEDGDAEEEKAKAARKARREARKKRR